MLAFPTTRVLYDQVVKYPQEVIPLMDHCISSLYLELFDDVSEQSARLKTRPFNLESSVNMRELDPQSKFDIDMNRILFTIITYERVWQMWTSW